MLNLFELFVKVGVDDQASGKLKNIGDKLGSGLKTSAKIGLAAVSAAAAGITALTTAAVNSYAEYEQLVGGAELMFGKAFETVMENSKNAYKTVQMSQNEYLQQVNGFATGLKTALGGNEQAAADLAHKIVQAEADIVAATGNSAENVQNAFNGIMKSNFTMLDNLQIGITPTKEGFQEVINKVNEWNAEMGNATNYQMGNLADMQSALVDYIDMVGMSGYAQAEAAGTISGSLASMKSAWQNLITGIADGNADLSTLMDNFITTIVGDGTETNLGVLGNIFPVIETALSGIGSLVEKIVPIIAEKLPGIIAQILPSLITASVSLITGLVQALPQIAQILINQVPVIMNSLSKEILSLLPQLVKLGMELTISIALGIAESLPELLDATVNMIIEIVDTLTDPATLSRLLEASTAIVWAIAEYLIDPNTVNQLLDSSIKIVENLVQFLMENLEPLLDAAIQMILALADFLLEPENIEKMISTAIELVVTIAGAIIAAAGELAAAAAELIIALVAKFKETDWGEIGRNIISGIKTGIQNAWKNLKEWFSGLFDDLIGIAKKILGIKSPSRVFRDQIGKQMAAGLGIGWAEEFENVKKEIEDSLDFPNATIGISTSIGSVRPSGFGDEWMFGRGVNVVQNIYSEAKTAADLMEEAIYQQERAVMLGV